MNSENEKPVVFLAFANEQEHRLNYLRNLPTSSMFLAWLHPGKQNPGLRG
jgi:hypothetical protein